MKHNITKSLALANRTITVADNVRWTIGITHPKAHTHSRDVLLRYMARDTQHLQAKVDYSVIVMLSGVHASRLSLLSQWRSVQQIAKNNVALFNADDLDTSMYGEILVPVRQLIDALPPSPESSIDDCYGCLSSRWGLYIGQSTPGWAVTPPATINPATSSSDIMASFVAAVQSYDPAIVFPFSHTPETLTPAVASLLEEAARKNLNQYTNP